MSTIKAVALTWLISITALVSFSTTVRGDLHLCAAAQPITHQISVHLVQTNLNDGTDPSPIPNNGVFGYVDQIFGQIGIDVQFSVGPTWNHTVAHNGQADLFSIISAASTVGVNSPQANTINLYSVDILPQASSAFSDNSAAGLAVVGGNGIALWSGPTLLATAGGQQIVASVLAHEIGHNLGLSHIVEAFNLMQASGSSSLGECFNTAQVITIFNNAPGFLTAVPEPTSWALMTLTSLLIAAPMKWQQRVTGTARDEK